MAIEGFTLLFDLGMILIAATLFNYLARLLGQPPLLAFIAAGLFIGPLGLGAMDLSVGGVPLGVNTTQEILILSQLGVAFLLFSVGIETSYSKLKELGGIALLGTVLQVVLTVLLVFVCNVFLHALSFQQSLYLGLIVAFSSTSIVVKILSDSREINTLHGRLMIGFLLVQDVLAIIAMPFLTNLATALSASIVAGLIAQVLVLLGIAYLLNRHVYPKLFRFASDSDELFFLSAMSSVFAFIFISYLIGFPIAVGAFIAGMTISTLPYSTEVSHRLRGVRDFLATIFFVTLGIQITPSFMSAPLALALILVLIVFVLKPLVFYAITLFSGYGNRTSLIVALAMAQVSEFSFIIAGQGKAVLEQTQGLYSFIILLIAVSLASTPYFMAGTEELYASFTAAFPDFAGNVRRNRFFHREISKIGSTSVKAQSNVVIFGGGTAGSGIAASLRGGGVVVVDSDPEVINMLTQRGLTAVYGSVDNQEAWHKAGVDTAKIVVLATPFSKASPALVRHVKAKGNAVVFARAHYFREAISLYNAGADLVVMPQVVGGNLFIRKIEEYLKKGRVEEMGGYKQEFIHYLKEKSLEEKPGPLP